MLPASKETDVESASGLQELYTTPQGNIYVETATVESEASSESYQELVASKSFKESPGETYPELVDSESYYENPGEVTSSTCSQGNIYENPSSTG